MPYGFNDDKSMFDLSDIGGLTRETATLASGTTGALECVSNGIMAVLSGVIVPTFTYTSAQWITVGTLAEILPEVECGGAASALYVNGVEALRITTGGTIQLYVRSSNESGVEHYVNVAFIVAR